MRRWHALVPAGIASANLAKAHAFLNTIHVSLYLAGYSATSIGQSVPTNAGQNAHLSINSASVIASMSTIVTHLLSERTHLS